MATFPCTVAEFNKVFVDFNRETGDKSNTQESIQAGYKCLSLHYLGVQTDTHEELERCATLLQIATSGAARRGWDI